MTVADQTAPIAQRPHVRPGTTNGRYRDPISLVRLAEAVAAIGA
jgi:hypothetical protein